MKHFYELFGIILKRKTRINYLQLISYPGKTQKIQYYFDLLICCSSPWEKTFLKMV